MPKRVNLMKPVVKGEPMTLMCEWESCDFMFVEMATFMDHVTSHLQNLLAFIKAEQEKGGQVDTDLSFACYWQECTHEPFSDFNSLVRHVYFHTFHIKLKSHGMVMILRNNIRGCLLDRSARNLIPDIPERFSCGWEHCSGVFDNPELFYLHIANHCDVFPAGNNVKDGCPCGWEGCQTVTKSKHKLKDHMRAHTQEKLAACPTCGALFCNMSRLYDHLKRQVENEGHSYQCSHCNKKYSTERLLKEHMRHHVNHFQCPFCDMTCPTPSNLKLHFRYRHSDARPYICDQCPHTCKTQHDLRRHQETHKTWIHCDMEECGFRCHAVADLNRHYKLKHEATEGQGCHRFQCHLCPSCYMAAYKLTSHLRKHHKFRWPPGHVRFRYKYHNDGFYRLQTVRYESIELTQQILATDIAGEMETAPVPHDSDNYGNQLETSHSRTKHVPNSQLGTISGEDSQSGNGELEYDQSMITRVAASQAGICQVVDGQSQISHVVDSQSQTSAVINSQSQISQVVDSQSQTSQVINSQSQISHVVDSQSQTSQVINSQSQISQVVDSQSQTGQVVDCQSQIATNQVETRQLRTIEMAYSDSGPTLRINQQGQHQPESNQAAEPADVYEDIVIRDHELPADGDVNYSYNLDLLGDVALKDSSLSDDRAHSQDADGAKNCDAADIHKMHTGTTQLDTPVTIRNSGSRQKKGKRTRLSMEAGEEVMQGNSINKRVRSDKQLLDINDDSNGQEEGLIYHSTPIKHVSESSHDVNVKLKQSNVQPIVNISDQQQRSDSIVVANDLTYMITVAPNISHNLTQQTTLSPITDIQEKQLMSNAPQSKLPPLSTGIPCRSVSTKPKVISIKPIPEIFAPKKLLQQPIAGDILMTKASRISNPITIFPIAEVGPVLSIKPNSSEMMTDQAMSDLEMMLLEPVPDQRDINYQPVSSPGPNTGPSTDNNGMTFNVGLSTGVSTDQGANFYEPVATLVQSTGISIEQTQAQFEGLIPLESINISASDYMPTSGALTELHPLVPEEIIHENPPLPNVKPTIHGVTMVTVGHHNEPDMTQMIGYQGNMVSVPIDYQGDRSDELDPDIHNDLKAAVGDLETSPGSETD